jgi:multidrug efflux pump subunit AcrA (membrane-fusion protein)
MKKRLMWAAVTLAVLGGIGYGALRFSKVALASTGTSDIVPTTKVKRGQVRITVAARGELQGGNSEMLTAPMVGGGDLPITVLRQPGELVGEGDVVVQFDTTQQEYNLREAEADLAEAEQQVIRAQAESEATDEETRWAVLSAESDVKVAEWEMKRNPVEPAIVRRQNELDLDAAKGRLRQAQQDIKNKQTTSASGIAIQQANQNKAKVMAELAQKNIDSMTLKAKTAGYVNVQQNMNMNMMYWGMSLPPFQVGDSARSGMAVAQIPDLKSWEISAKVGELDRGRLSPGQPVTVKVVALAGKEFKGKVKNMGGTSGPQWDRNFETRITLDDGAPELRPGMTSNLVIVAETLENALWVPFQAVFESDGRQFVYRQTANGFMPHDIKLVKRSESQVVLEGLNEGETIAMSNPDQSSKAGQAPQGQQNGAMKALSK